MVPDVLLFSVRLKPCLQQSGLHPMVHRTREFTIALQTVRITGDPAKVEWEWEWWDEQGIEDQEETEMWAVGRDYETH